MHASHRRPAGQIPSLRIVSENDAGPGAGRHWSAVYRTPVSCFVVHEDICREKNPSRTDTPDIATTRETYLRASWTADDNFVPGVYAYVGSLSALPMSNVNTVVCAFGVSYKFLHGR